MNIIIPLGGKGDRFTICGYTQPKPLIKIFEKCMIEYVLDNLIYSNEDKIFIIYNSKLDNYDFNIYICNKYPFIQLIKVNDTKGAVETLSLGIEIIMSNYSYNAKCLILDCDTFYTEDILDVFRSSKNNMVFYTKNYETEPIYSYIEMVDDCIINIKEKEKISDNANTGAYAFVDITHLYNWCKHVLDNKITFNNEPYTSCVISEMIKSNILFNGYELQNKQVFSLGTPHALNVYINNTHACLFDLDGTLVLTDMIYYNVWCKILLQYNITLTNEMFNTFIQGNNDTYVLNTLLKNINISLTDLSRLKDDLFIANINKIQIVDGVYNALQHIKSFGHKACIVTNCNKRVSNEIIKHINITHLIDFIISADDCVNGKPHSEPYMSAIHKYNIKNNKCFVFEDSKTGLLSGNGVNAKLIIGVETIYNNAELLKYGANVTIKNYLNFNIDTLISSKKNDVNIFISLIKNNSLIDNIKDIIFDTDKLKGGYIADVIGFKCVTANGCIYSQILKYENASETNDLSIMAKKLDLYNREYYFYEKISNKININIPKFYNLILNDDFNNVGIVLENLFDKKYKINLNLNEENIDLSLKIVDNMAKMHSKFWNKNLKKMFPKLKKSDDDAFCPFFTYFLNERYELFKNKWFSILNTNHVDSCNEIFKNFSNIQQRFSLGNNLTFIHGDIKSPNIFYDTENNNDPYFIDWQHCAIGKGVQDLIFFIIESFDIVNIKLIFDLTTKYYYKKLLEYGIANYSIDEYENDIYDAICYIPFFTSVWFGTTPQDELIDKNFPYFLISKMCYLIENIKNNFTSIIC
jgi:beta-phosphoglucomutase-like phosphatase (HAD superfamily)/dTDP-glucose pyrophosphorylase